MDVVRAVKDSLELLTRVVPGLFTQIQLTRKGAPVHTPGEPAAYPLNQSIHTGIMIDFTEEERKTNLAQLQDMRVLLYPHTDTSIIPKPGDDLLVVGQTYRIIDLQRILTGSEIVLFDVHVRPT